MIKQCAVTDIESRSECNPYDSTGFLPLIVAPMYSCVNKHNAHVFLDNKIKVCMPRKEYMDETYTHCSNENYFDSYSLEEFVENFINSEDGFLNDSNHNKVKTSVCIDTAAGHLKKLHNAIRKAKEIHGDKLIIMAGNVASIEAFVELAKTGVDYIRVGIGGGGGCNTTSNTGVGQRDLEYLIKDCFSVKNFTINTLKTQPLKYGATHYIYKQIGTNITGTNQEFQLISKVKIVADGISTYIKQCQDKYGFNDNGYAAINSLLFAGADLVMVGKLFAQCLESAGEKACFSNDNEILIQDDKDQNEILFKEKDNLYVKYSGMSTQEEQKKYKKVLDHSTSLEFGEPAYSMGQIKPSEGSVNWIPVRFLLKEWIWGNESQDTYPYLMGWINSIKSAMSYTGKNTIE